MSFPIVSKLDNIVGIGEKLNKSKISNLRYNRFTVFFTFLSFKLTKCHFNKFELYFSSNNNKKNESI